MKTHSIAALAQWLDLFATRFCMPTPQPLRLPKMVRSGAAVLGVYGRLYFADVVFDKWCH
jgi:hypothetical protein